MAQRIGHLIAGLCAAGAGLSAALALDGDTPANDEAVVVPKLWDAAVLADWATPVAGLNLAPEYFTPEEYYAAPVDNLMTYPVYHPDREPPGYRESLPAKGPQPIIDPSALRTKADWIAAGQRVFEALDTALSRTDDPGVIAHFTNAQAVDKFRDAAHDVVDKDGVLLDYRWVVSREGKLQLTLSSCSGCHTRLMPDGSTLPGAPCNFDLGESPAAGVMLAQLRVSPDLSAGAEFYAGFGVPWRADDPHKRFQTATDDEVAAFLSQETGAPPGTTFNRVNGSPFNTTRMADLRNVRDRKFLDATATHRNRGPADVARYGILVEFADRVKFGPHDMLPPGLKIPLRPPDEAMYAMALYIYSLGPAPSPHPFDERAARGKRLFEDEGCIKCHTPPLYTNNKLIRAPGFEPPDDSPPVLRGEVSDRRVHTDPGLALMTRKGTGYYKVPMLRGVWYRGLFGHCGFVTSLEDWFDPARLNDDYIPTGWRGPGVEKRAVPGHEFGLDLTDEEKADLIAFLRTL